MPRKQTGKTGSAKKGAANSKSFMAEVKNEPRVIDQITGRVIKSPKLKKSKNLKFLTSTFFFEKKVFQAVKNGSKFYRVRWEGNSEETWELEKILKEECPEKLEEFDMENEADTPIDQRKDFFDEFQAINSI